MDTETDTTDTTDSASTASTATHEGMTEVFRKTLLDAFTHLPLRTVLIPTGLRYKTEGNAYKCAVQRELIRELRPQDLPEFDRAMTQPA